MSVRIPVVKTCSALLTMAMMLVAQGAAAQSVKVGFVNVARIEAEAAPFTRAAETLRKEFEPRNRELQEFQKRIEAARQQFESEKDRLPAAEAQAKAREISGMMVQSDQVLHRITEEFNLRRKELGAVLLEDARVAIKAVAEAGKFDLILQEAIFARPGIDITGDVLKEMEKRAGAPQ